MSMTPLTPRRKPHIVMRLKVGTNWPMPARSFEVTLCEGGRPLHVITDGWKALACIIEAYRATGDQGYGGLYLGYR